MTNMDINVHSKKYSQTQGERVPTTLVIVVVDDDDDDYDDINDDDRCSRRLSPDESTL